MEPTITENCGIPFLGIHTTRHTHARLLLKTSASQKEVHILRHTSIKMTIDTYSHLPQESKEKSIETLKFLPNAFKMSFTKIKKIAEPLTYEGFSYL